MKQQIVLWVNNHFITIIGELTNLEPRWGGKFVINCEGCWFEVFEYFIVI